MFYWEASRTKNYIIICSILEYVSVCDALSFSVYIFQMVGCISV